MINRGIRYLSREYHGDIENVIRGIPESGWGIFHR